MLGIVPSVCRRKPTLSGMERHPPPTVHYGKIIAGLEIVKQLSKLTQLRRKHGC